MVDIGHRDCVGGLFQTKRPLFSAQAFMPCKAFAERLRREKGLSPKIRDAN